MTPSSSSQPVLLSPALPSELLSYILQCHRHPTVLVICGTRQHFLMALTHDVLQQVSLGLHGTHLAAAAAAAAEDESLPAHQLLVAPLAQVAVSRHIRLVFVPTVTHLEAWLTVFDPGDTTIPPPPLQQHQGQHTRATSPSSGKHHRDVEQTQQQSHPQDSNGRSRGGRTTVPARPPRPLLLVYGFLSLHRDTSEWSAQGIGNTAAALVEAADRTKFRAAVVEPLEYDEEGGVRDLAKLLGETVPILSGAARREIDGDEGGRWTGRTVDVERIVRRWFTVEDGEWEDGRAEVMPLPTQADEEAFSQILEVEEETGESQKVYEGMGYEDVEMAGAKNVDLESLDGFDLEM